MCNGQLDYYTTPAHPFRIGTQCQPHYRLVAPNKCEWVCDAAWKAMGICDGRPADQQHCPAQASQPKQLKPNMGSLRRSAVNGNWAANTCTVTHTNSNGAAYGEAQPWWEVDLQGRFKVRYVRVWNRLDGSSQRLNRSRLRWMGKTVMTSSTTLPPVAM